MPRVANKALLGISLGPITESGEKISFVLRLSVELYPIEGDRFALKPPRLDKLEGTRQKRISNPEEQSAIVLRKIATGSAVSTAKSRQA